MPSLETLAKLQEIGVWTPSVWKTQSQRKGPSRLLRALKRTRAPLTAFGMTISFLERVSGSRNHSRQGCWAVACLAQHAVYTES
jgi:hypothetical protein